MKMKTKVNYPGIKWILVSGIVLSNVFGFSGYAQQNSKIRVHDVSILTTVSGNGFGMHYNPLLGIRLTDRIVLSGGGVFRASNNKLAGWITHTTFTLLKPENSLTGQNSLYGYFSFEKYTQQGFSKNWIETEKLVSRFSTDQAPFENVSFRGYETSLGFGTGRDFTHFFSLFFESGVSIYKVNRNNYQDLKLYHQPKGFNLHLSIKAVFKM